MRVCAGRTSVEQASQEMMEKIAQAKAEAEIRRLIAGYMCVRGNKIDHSKTEQVKRDLAALEKRVGEKRCAVRTLGLVQEALRNIEN